MHKKFYPLELDEWLSACKDLTKSQLSILYYLRTVDPYSNGLKIKASVIAEELGISRKTVYESISVLKQKAYIELEDAEYILKVIPKGCKYDTFHSVTDLSPPGNCCHPQVTVVTPGLHDSPPGNKIHPQVTVVTPGLQSPPETIKQQAFQNPKINKEFKDFKDSLSKSQRESFLKFGLEKAQKLPHPPELPHKWIEAHWQEISAEWMKVQGRSPGVEQQQWQNHPCRNEWIEKIRSLGQFGFYAENRQEEKERREFFKWADANNLIWGEKT
ncbi:hypothetical protein [Anabaena sp. CCY 0017]|uniref:hypothetical protein n=1 Tax=Anabaena sp. CCY 0017 TaxID=3103866 RepID=UPI0039C671B5